MNEKTFGGWYVVFGVFAIYPLIYLVIEIYDFLELHYQIENLPFGIHMFIGLNLVFTAFAFLALSYAFLYWFFYEKNKETSSLKDIFSFIFSIMKGFFYANAMAAFMLIVMYVIISIADYLF